MEKKINILFTGEWKSQISIISMLTEAGYVVSIAPIGDASSISCDMIITKASSKSKLIKITNSSVPWLVCFTESEPELINLAYQYGALAVFPDGTTDSVLMQFIQRSLTNGKQLIKKEDEPKPITQRRYQKGDIIILEPDTIMEIQNGILSQNMVYQNGSEVLMGLFGTGQIIIPHPSDSCYIQLIAHTDLYVSIKSWEMVSTDPNLNGKLRNRMQQMEAWTAMQARQHLDERVLGLLSLLSEQFGSSTPEGVIVDVRLTHNQLASAAGATRTTITRTLGDLKHQNRLSIVTTADGERFCLHEWEHGHHNPH